MRKTILLAAALIAVSGGAFADKPVNPVKVGDVLNVGAIQANVATAQIATTNVSKIGAGVASVDTIAVGNNLTGSAETINSSLGLNGIVQVNAIAIQDATTNISKVGVGKLDVTTAAVGNNIDLTATKTLNADPIQVNALTAQVATTNLSNAGVGNLSIATQAVGNAASFTVKK